MNIKNFSQNKLINVKKYLILALYLIVLWLVLPISLAIFFAYFLYPIVQLCHKKIKIPYTISAIIVSSLIFALIYFLFHMTLQSIITIYPEVKEQVQQLSIVESTSSIIFEKIFSNSLSYIDSMLINFGNVMQNFISYVVDVFIFIVAFYFSLFESRKNRLWFFIYVPKEYRRQWKTYFTKATNLFGYFLYVEFQLAVITFILLSTGLALLQFEHPITKGFLIALADMLPFFGIGIFLIPLSIYFFLIDQIYLGISIILLYIFIQLTRQLVESLLWSSTFHLRTIHTFFITATSILLFGFYGILLSPFILLIAVKYKQKAISE